MSNKGQFSKGNKAAVKKNKSHYELMNDAHKVNLPTEKKETETLPNDYMPFGDDNLFPQRTTELNRKSPISRSVIASKRNYIVAQGFQTDNAKFKTFKPNPNSSLSDVTSKLAYDKLVSGNAYMEIVRGKGVVQFYHIDTTKCRVHKEGKHIIIHPNWSKYNNYKKLAKVVPIYPYFEFIDGFERSIVHIKEYEQEYNYYGIPSNIASIDSANINYKTNKWNLSRLENAFNSSGILMLQADFSNEDAEKFDNDFNNKFIGEGNTGKVLKIVNEIGGEPNSSKFIPITTNEEGHWQTLHNQATQEIIISNQWFASLAGLNVSSGFDTNRIRNDYQIAMATVISSEQKIFIELYEKVLNEQLKFNINDLEFINKSPISLVDLTNVHTAIISINTEVVEGRMTTEQAKKVLQISFQLSDKEVNEIFI